MKKAWKLQEYVSHSPGNVTSLALSPKSGTVMATGGEDRKVNLWAVGKPSTILSLSGHTSPISSVEFDCNEIRVVAGAMSGVIRVWDLEEAKILRNLAGHTVSVTASEFHPIGNFLATGSLDKTVKIWDITRKGLINSYRGHDDAITMLKFSPDGKWLVSASRDSTIKIWDLSAGKMLTQFTDHKACVNCVAFHPTVLLLASGSDDKTIKMWDLESLTLLGSSHENDFSSPIQRIAFHPQGECLYASSSDYLKIVNYETSECLESVNVGWGKHTSTADIAFATRFNQLIGASFAQSVVSTYVVDVKNCQPFIANNIQPSNESGSKRNDLKVNNATMALSSARKSFARDPDEIRQNCPKEDEQVTNLSPSGNPSPVSFNDQDDRVTIEDQATYEKVFLPSNTIPRSPKLDEKKIDSPFSPPVQTPSKKNILSGKANKDNQTILITKKIPKTNQKELQANTIKVDIDDFLPKTPMVENRPSPIKDTIKCSSPIPLSEVEVTDHLVDCHESLMAALQFRGKCLASVHGLWRRDNNAKNVLDATLSMRDMSVVVDVLSILTTNSTFWTMDLAAQTFPHLVKLVNSKYDTHLEAGCLSIKEIMRNFSKLIKETINFTPALGVDLSREERFEKCKICNDGAKIVYNILADKATRRRAGIHGKELHLMLQIHFS